MVDSAVDEGAAVPLPPAVSFLLSKFGRGVENSFFIRMTWRRVNSLRMRLLMNQELSENLALDLMERRA